jgi:hypothetical protein
VPTPQEEVIQVRVAAIATEAARAAVVHSAKASAKGVTMAQENIMTLIKDAEDWAALADREARDRMLRLEVESATSFASPHGEVEDFARRIAYLEGELAEACQA